MFGQSGNARAVESQAVEVLDFLIRFLDEELLPLLPSHEAEQSTTDMERIRAGLEPIRERTVQCPDCDQRAFVPDRERNRVHCQFCSAVRPADDGAIAYAVSVLGRDPMSPDLFGMMAVEVCPDCNDECPVPGAKAAAAPDDPVYFCFACARAVPGMMQCSRCFVLCRPREGKSVCPDCVAAGT